MSVRNILLDRSFLLAVCTDTDVHPSAANGRDEALLLYADLVDGFEAGTNRLFALDTVLADLPADVRPTVLSEWPLVERIVALVRGRQLPVGNRALAPVSRVRVTRQRRTAAARTALFGNPNVATMFPNGDMPADEAVAHEFALTLVTLRREGIRTIVTMGHAYDGFDLEVIRPVSSGTAPPLARQSTDG